MRFAEQRAAAVRQVMAASGLDSAPMTEAELLRVDARLRRASRGGVEATSEVDVLRALQGAP